MQYKLYSLKECLNFIILLQGIISNQDFIVSFPRTHTYKYQEIIVYY